MFSREAVVGKPGLRELRVRIRDILEETEAFRQTEQPVRADPISLRASGGGLGSRGRGVRGSFLRLQTPADEGEGDVDGGGVREGRRGDAVVARGERAEVGHEESEVRTSGGESLEKLQETRGSGHDVLHVVLPALARGEVVESG